jgi:hypothetical protein
LTNQPGPVRARLAFQPLCEGDSGSLDRLAPGPRPVVCLVGFRVPRTLPQADAARACVAPVPPRGPPNRLPCHFAAYSTSGYPATVPGSCRGRYHTDRQPGAALPNTAMCPAGPPARSQAVRADHRKGQGSQQGEGLDRRGMDPRCKPQHQAAGRGGHDQPARRPRDPGRRPSRHARTSSSPHVAPAGARGKRANSIFGIGDRSSTASR